MDAPCSSYSALEIQLEPNELREARVEAPLQTAYLRSGVATILISEPAGARASISYFRRSGMPSYMVVPPERMMFLRRSLRTSISDS